MKADIVYFQKKCPKCNSPMIVAQKRDTWWYVCHNKNCEYNSFHDDNKHKWSPEYA